MNERSVSLASLILGILQSAGASQTEALQAFTRSGEYEKVQLALSRHPATSKIAHDTAQTLIIAKYNQELHQLTSSTAGYRSNAANMSAERILDFSCKKMGENFHKQAPYMWSLLGILLKSEADLQDPDIDEISSTENREAHSGDLDDDASGEEEEDIEASSGGRSQKARRRRQELSIVKRVTIISVVMNNRNTLCNAFQTVFGLFLHSCNTPEKVVETLAHSGLSVGSTSINNMITSMSAESAAEIIRQCQSATGQGLDNLEVYLKTDQPTIETKSKLIHMTTATFLPLNHGVIMEDLKCVKELWEKSPFNSNATEPPLTANHDALCSLAAKASRAPEDPASQSNLMAWHVRNLLISHIDGLKEEYGSEHGTPFMLAPIPVMKTKQIPAKAMNVDLGTASGNGVALENLAQQAG
ncbi:hypothetical protein FRB90_012123 [Tulasnella sp. 427]|nr:hypothetical protein FRB90_012123 [Tulasnella sp. 427]